MADLDSSVQVLGYGLAGVATLLLAVLLSTSFRGRLQGGLLTAAAIVSAAWCALLAWDAHTRALTSLGIFLVEMVHDAAWLVFLTALLSGAVGARRVWLVRWGGIVLVAALLALGLGKEIYRSYDPLAPGSGGTLVLGSLLTSLYALVLIEQIYRNARESQRDGLKFLCLGMGGFFAYDLLLYSNAILVGGISPLLWGARGFVVAMCVPLIAIAAQRSPSWSVGIFVSRQVVFYTATLVGAGVYLTIVGFIGYHLRVVGGEWGAAAQLVLFSAAIIGLFVFLFSDAFRAQVRVFINKHFFANKYDYREEWLRLIATLTATDDGVPLRKRGIKALSQIVDSDAGVLWAREHDSDEFACVSSWNVPCPGTRMSAHSALPGFLNKTGWVVDLEEYGADPSHYGDISIDAGELGLSGARYVVPLTNDGELLGFVVLSHSASVSALNYEDRDLLKTAGQQIASYLAQETATEQLAESRQFDAYNKLTAYLMHDLKNVIAQQSLLVKNAETHKNNPAFIDDAMKTIEGSVRRMRRVIEHLQQGSFAQRPERIELGKLIMTVVSQCADREPIPRAEVGDDRVWVRGDRERLQMAVYHAIRNAQDATEANGEVAVKLTVNGADCAVQVIDSGSGMNEAFIRDRLFKPFDSTKGTQGMGIGAYQLRETVRAMGGGVRVASRVNEGTCVSLELRRAER